MMSENWIQTGTGDLKPFTACRAVTLTTDFHNWMGYGSWTSFDYSVVSKLKMRKIASSTSLQYSITSRVFEMATFLGAAPIELLISRRFQLRPEKTVVSSPLAPMQRSPSCRKRTFLQQLTFSRNPLLVLWWGRRKTESPNHSWFTFYLHTSEV